MAVRAEQRVYTDHTVAEASPAFRTLISILLALSAAIAFVLAAIASLVVGYGVYFQDQVYPGVQAAGVELGGSSVTEVEATLNGQTDAYLDDELSFVYEGSTYTVTPSAIGIEFDNARTAEEAYQVGRGGSWWTDSWDWVDSLLFGQEVKTYATVDERALESYLRSISDEIVVPPTAPAFQVNDGAVGITEPANGLGIDVGQTRYSLAAEVSRLGDAPIEIETVEVEPGYNRSALEPVRDEVSSILSEPFTLERNGFSWQLDSEQLERLVSVEVDPENGESSLAINRSLIESHLSNIADEAEGAGSNASVYWSGQEFEVNPASDGWIIDVEESVDLVAEAILSGERSAELAIASREAEVTTAEARESAEYGNQLAESRFGLVWDGGETEMSGSVIAATLNYELDEDSGALVTSLDTDELEQYLSSVSSDIEVEPVNADLRYYDGEVVVESEEELGLEMDREASAEAIAEAVENGDSSAEIVVRETEPEVLAAMADDIEIREELASGETYYHGSSANRAHNVELATERANGKLVPPGGTYSFVESIGGEINLETGYRQGYGIVGATDGGVSTVPSVGGGVCQVSTTLFHAAFWAGMEIGERNWHLYWIPTYGQQPSGMTGLDATVDTDAGLDFTFENTTDDWIAVVASAGNGTVRFEIHGTDPNWRIETDGPFISNRVSADSETVYEESSELPAGTEIQVETANDGFDVLIERRVFDSDGELIDELDVASNYRPASNRVLVGTGN